MWLINQRQPFFKWELNYDSLVSLFSSSGFSPCSSEKLVLGLFGKFHTFKMQEAGFLNPHAQCPIFLLSSILTSNYSKTTHRKQLKFSQGASLILILKKKKNDKEYWKWEKMKIKRKWPIKCDRSIHRTVNFIMKTNVSFTFQTQININCNTCITAVILNLFNSYQCACPKTLKTHLPRFCPSHATECKHVFTSAYIPN